MRPVDKGEEPKEKYSKYQDAEESLRDWKVIKDQEDKESYLKNTMQLAKAKGFFSVWMEVFKEYKEVQKRLIEEFKGTNKSFFEDVMNKQ